MNEDSPHAQLLLSIICYTKGRWCIEDVVSAYMFILDEMKDGKPDLKIVPLELEDDGSRD